MHAAGTQADLFWTEKPQREPWNGGLLKALGLGASVGYSEEQTARHGLHPWRRYAE